MGSNTKWKYKYSSVDMPILPVLNGADGTNAGKRELGKPFIVAAFTLALPTI
jgi:hypothetical protein